MSRRESRAAAQKAERPWAEADIEAGPDNGGDGDSDSDDRSAALNRFRTATSVSMSPELFEKLYLTPKNNSKSNLRATFGNPSPMCVCPPRNTLLAPARSRDLSADARLFSGGFA